MEEVVLDFAVAGYKGRAPLYIRDVPTLECQQCGARAYSSAVSEVLGKAHRLPPHFAHLDVRGFHFQGLQFSDGTLPCEEATA